MVGLFFVTHVQESLLTMHPAGIEPASQESESYVLSIILRLQDD